MGRIHSHKKVRSRCSCDVRGDPDSTVKCVHSAPSDVGINLALSLAQAGRPTQLIIPGLCAEYEAFFVNRLSLEPLDTEHLWESSRTFGFHMYAPPLDDSEVAADSFVTTRVRERIAADPSALTLLVLPPGAPHSSWLAAGRVANAYLLLVAMGSSRTSKLVNRVGEVNALGSRLLGLIAVPSRRRLHVQQSRGAKVTNELEVV